MKRAKSRQLPDTAQVCLGKKVVLGVSGGIAAYKSAEVLRRLQDHGAEIRVVMTAAACHLVTPWTFQSLSGHSVMTELFAPADERVPHIHLAEWGDLVLVAPATANLIGKAACGIADDALSTILLACKVPLFLAPAMNPSMYEHPAVQHNIRTLRERGCHLIEPGQGWLACGTEGQGRMAEPQEIVERIRQFFVSAGSLSGRRVLVTAGRTEEPIDPVRMLTNPATGKMGYALAQAAKARGAEVVLVSGPSDLPAPAGVVRIMVRTAEEMATQTLERLDDCDIVLMAAAVSDFRPTTYAAGKIKKTSTTQTLDLEPTTDILLEIGRRKGRRILVGFALETEQGLTRARQKLDSKKLDLIALNNPLQAGCGFAGDTNALTLLDRSGNIEALPMMSKREAADIILDRVSTLSLTRPGYKA